MLQMRLLYSYNTLKPKHVCYYILLANYGGFLFRLCIYVYERTFQPKKQPRHFLIEN